MQNNRTYIIALTGPAAAGKTTVGKYLSQNFRNDYTLVRQEDYKKDPSTFSIRGYGSIWDDPQSIRFDVMASHLLKLKCGKEVTWQTFAEYENEPIYRYTLRPKRFIILDGDMILEDEKIRALADIKIYLDIPSEMTFVRKALFNREVVVPVLERHKRIQKFHADYVVDANKTKLEVVQEVRDLILSAVTTNENKSIDTSYVSGLWNQSNGTEYLSGYF